LIGNVLVVDTDRSLAGQDGEAYVPGSTAGSDTFPARLAERLFEADPEIQRVHVMSNAVSVARAGGWADEAVDTAHDIITRFFEYY
ncbi:MAG TPA: hypothetical protein VK088_08370, partial [Acidimicrobiia bacterium]|nr:hypothetical protein [Acidimicrobiia bacterium]